MNSINTPVAAPRAITLIPKQKFENRRAIFNELGGDLRRGISTSKKVNAILLIRNEKEHYRNDFYSENNEKILYIGIGNIGNQDDVKNNSDYNLNIEVFNHKRSKKKLIIFNKTSIGYEFLGEYKLSETHQNTHPDINGNLRRVFVFHLERISENCSLKLMKIEK